MRTSTKLLILGEKTFASRIAATAPALWLKLDETSGAAAANSGSLGTAANGSYVGCTLDATKFLDGAPAPNFNGASSTIEIFSGALAGAFNASEGSVLIWAKTAAWTDGVSRILMTIGSDLNNRVFIAKDAANNTLRLYFISGGVVQSNYYSSPRSFSNWFSFGFTWKRSANQIWIYVNGAQIVSSPYANDWLGALANNLTEVGSIDGSWFWSGYLSNALFWTRELTSTEMAKVGIY